MAKDVAVSMMKTILLLGGSAQQIPALECAKKKGYSTILCDYLPDNPGQYYCDKFYCVSTTDKSAVLDVAVREKIDGVVSYASDPAATTAAYVAENLGLATNPYKSVQLLTNKDQYREFLLENGFYTPLARGYSSINQAKKDIERFRMPVFIKPTDSSGSKGVSKIGNRFNLEDSAKDALTFSRSKRFVVEEFVEKSGYQVAGDGFSINGVLVFRSFANDHFNENSANPFVPVSASFPYNMPKRIHVKIHDEIQRLFDLLEMRTGAYNFDILIDQDENVYLMEIGPRNGGNYIPQVIRYSTGIDMVDYTLRAAMGEDCSDLKMVESTGYWSYYAVHSLISGILKEIRIDRKIEENYIVEKHLNYDIGDFVHSFTGANTNIGILIMRFDSMEQMLYMMDNPKSWIDVIVEKETI